MKRTVSYLIKLLSLAVTVTFAMPAEVTAQRDKADFSGAWRLYSMSYYGSERMMITGSFRKIFITQDSNLLSNANTGSDGTETVAKYTLDGKECINTTGNKESKSVASWSANGKSLTISTTMEYEGYMHTIISVWSMPAEDTLSIVTTAPGRPQRKNVTRIYTRL